MDYARLGTSDLTVSRLALGMMSYGNTTRRDWHLLFDQAEPIVRRAVDGGVTLFDTADMYDAGGSEEVTGRLLRRLFAKREDYVLATRVYFPVEPGSTGGLSAGYIKGAIDASLRRLGTDYVDLYQIHRWDDEVPIEETMQALDDVVKAGKARAIGASSMYAWQFAKAQYTARLQGLPEFVSMQNHYNLVYREEEREMLPLCQDLGAAVLPYSPLARGLLATTVGETVRRPTTRGGNDPLADSRYDEGDLPVVRAVREVAGERAIPPAQVALAWLLHKGVCAPIVGATKLSHLEDALAAEEVSLTDDEVRRLEAPYRPHRVIGHS